MIFKYHFFEVHFEVLLSVCWLLSVIGSPCAGGTTEQGTAIHGCDLVSLWSNRYQVLLPPGIRRPCWQCRKDKAQLLFDSLTKLFSRFEGEKTTTQTQNVKAGYCRQEEPHHRDKGRELFSGPKSFGTTGANWQTADRTQTTESRTVLTCFITVVCSRVPGGSSLPVSLDGLPPVSLTIRGNVQLLQAFQRTCSKFRHSWPGPPSATLPEVCRCSLPSPPVTRLSLLSTCEPILRGGLGFQLNIEEILWFWCVKKTGGMGPGFWLWALCSFLPLKQFL